MYVLIIYEIVLVILITTYSIYIIDILQIIIHTLQTVTEHKTASIAACPQLFYDDIAINKKLACTASLFA